MENGKRKINFNGNGREILFRLETKSQWEIPKYFRLSPD